MLPVLRSPLYRAYFNRLSSFRDGYKPDTRAGQGTADLPKHCLERYSLDHDFHPLQKGASRGLEDALH